jgi:ABC-type antimicrobial peptide transport system permease subunit
MVLLMIAATMALLLGVIGIYGLMTYVATQRIHEVGIRLALGAQIRDVQAMFLRQGVLLTVTGIALGACTAMGLTPLMSALLFGVEALDPLTYLLVSSLLACVAILATYLPARRVARIDPVVALRSDRRLAARSDP